MFIFRIIFFLWDLYTLALIVNFVLPFFVKTQQPWMAILSKVCEPAVQVGNIVAAKLFQKQKFSFNIGALMAIAVCIVVGFVASIIVF